VIHIQGTDKNPDRHDIMRIWKYINRNTKLRRGILNQMQFRIL